MIKEFESHLERSPEYLEEKFIHLVVNHNGISQKVSFTSSEKIDYIFTLLATAKAMLEKVEMKDGNA